MVVNTLGYLSLTAGIIVVAGALCVFGVVVYRVTLHPLAKYPGPLLGRITDWNIVIRSFMGDRHVYFLELHRKHGPFVRFGPNRLSINTMEGLQKVYGFKANTQKSAYYRVFGNVFKGENVNTTIHNDLHSKKRKAISSALSDSALKDMEELVLRNIRKSVQYLGRFEASSDVSPDNQEWSTPKNISEWAQYLTFDVMGDVCFSRSFRMLDDSDNRYLLKILPQGVNALNIGGWMPSLLHLGFASVFFPTVAKGLKAYQEFAEQQFTRRLSLGERVPALDVFSHLLKANKKSEEECTPLFGHHDLIGETSFLITAGSDTTGTAITVTIFYLLHNPETYERLKQEIRSRFKAIEDIRGGLTLNSCLWLPACVDEAMRMSPSMPGILPREALAPGVSIGGHFFKEGIELGVPHYAIHHNDEYYPDSFSYRPERWIMERINGETEEEAHRRVKLAQSAFCPFSLGPRGCVGKTLAMKEIMITIARIVWLYDMRLTPGEEHRGVAAKCHGANMGNELHMIDMFVSKTDGPMVQFRERVG